MNIREELTCVKIERTCACALAIAKERKLPQRSLMYMLQKLFMSKLGVNTYAMIAQFAQVTELELAI